MKKLLSIMFLSLILASGCAPVENAKESLKKVDIGVDLVGVKMTDNQFLSFDVLLKKPGVGLSEPIENEESLLVSDLPEGIQVRSIQADGSFCDIPRFPHRCEVKTEEGVDKKTINLEVEFADGTYGTTKLEVGAPPPAAAARILAPKSIPAQGSQFEITFEEVMADSYNVTLYMCEEYNNDGINPCLNEFSYLLKRLNGVLVVDENSNLFNPVLEEKDGLITLKADLKLYFSESVEFLVEAKKKNTILNTVYETVMTSRAVFETNSL